MTDIDVVGDCEGYKDGGSVWPANLRLMLTPVEEQQSSGLQRTSRPSPEWLRRGLYQPVDVTSCPVPASAILEAEDRLAGLVVMGSGAGGTSGERVPAYPLAVPGRGCGSGSSGSSGDSGSHNVGSGGSSALAAEMHAELKSSWEAHHTAPRHKGTMPGAADVIKQEQVMWAPHVHWQISGRVQM